MERYTKEMLWWMVVFVTLIALTLTLFIVAERAFPQDETTYYYDWGNDTWTQYETYDHNTGEWTRGTIIDQRDGDVSGDSWLWENSAEAQRMQDRHEERMEQIEEFRRRYTDDDSE